MELDKNQLLKLNYELADFWLQNFSNEQKNKITESVKQNLLSSENENSIVILEKNNKELQEFSLEDIKKYLLNQIKLLLECNDEEFKYMINYIILGALGIVIPKIKELYPDFIFAFKL